MSCIDDLANAKAQIEGTPPAPADSPATAPQQSTPQPHSAPAPTAEQREAEKADPNAV